MSSTVRGVKLTFVKTLCWVWVSQPGFGALASHTRPSRQRRGCKPRRLS